MRRLLLAMALLGIALACARSLPPARSGGEGVAEVGAGEGGAPASPPVPEPPLAGEPEAAPPKEAPPATATGPAEPIRLRVGLATDLEEIYLPCCRETLILGVGGRRWAVRSPIRLVPDTSSSRAGTFRLQVAALKDEGQARNLAQGLGERTGWPSGYHFDAGVDLYRVRVGRFPDREAAEIGRDRLAGLGVIDVWIVGEGGGVTDPAFVLLRQGEARGREAADSVRLDGRWLSVESQGGDSVPSLLPASGRGRRYRGRLLVYLNDRGKLNLINELTLDQYLRSVVPSEMGPELYGQPEALKAQAVAARTYTLRNLGEFIEEGYDICATPRCQVYQGMAAEHPLSDRAVAETSHQVLLYRGELIDARYSSTCGGHTEDVKVVFPLEDEPYLKGVPCPEAGTTHLGAGTHPGIPFPEGLTRRLLPPPPGTGGKATRAAFEARLLRLAQLAELPVPQDRLASLERGEVRRFIASLFDLALDPRLLAAITGTVEGTGDPPARRLGGGAQQASDRIADGLLDGRPGEVLTGSEGEVLLYALAELLQVVRQERAHFLSAGDGGVVVRTEGGLRTLVPAQPLTTFRLQGERVLTSELDLVAGDRLRLILRGRELVGLIQEVEAATSGFQLQSKYASWRQFRSDEELERLVAARYPELRLTGLEILSRGVSGRVGKVRLLGTGSKAVEVEGLAVRWTLDLPDTRFTARRVAGGDGGQGWVFDGSGWGHGVGLCQIGSVNLAGRGATYREILEHYYTGVELAQVRAAGERWPRDSEPPARMVGAP